MEEKNMIDLLKRVSLKDETFHLKAETWEEICRKRQVKAHRQSLRRICYSIAASVAILICVVSGLNSGVSFKSDHELLAIQLPDGSSVELDANSSIRYNKIQWWFNRQLNLNGNATFDVTKGKNFMVVTPAGTITVLGTRFFVSQKENNLHVACFEGAVRVETPSDKVTLHPGEQVDCDDAGMQQSEIKKESPEYLDYTDEPLVNIVRTLEEIYGVQIVNVELCDGLLFSGLVSTHNKNEALEVVFGACNLKYVEKNNQLILNR
ncbi:FecR family protein [Bacteroides timonensis]|uniref:FecR family protein n=1 Tax=Bacteroides timonensis TaxID=1470345 RepID=UPI0004B72E72|nr:FecR domain-containing protein [Bacteroides timonensis]